MMEKPILKGKKYLLYLVIPGQKYVNYYAQTELSRVLGKKKFMLPLAVPMVAALTPDHYDIRIIDEEMQKLPRKVIPDVVGISTLASTACRAYEIADFYRSAGAKVIMGGPYVSFMADEALQHADCVVVGEAEGMWEQALNDFENNNLKKIYRPEGFCAFKEIPPPRWDLIDMKKVFQVGMQVSRGCPYTCEFCLVTSLFGRAMRYRSIENVVKEIKSLPVKKILFVDDNLTVNKKYARELMNAIRPLGISWGCMASIEIADDAELLQLMAEAGCFNILIGFESLNPGSLYETKKKQNKDALYYKDAIRKIHAAGIHITASFVVGFDNDTPEEFDRIYEFTQQTGLSYINFNILGAPHGSELYNRLRSEGRIFDISPEMISGLFPCMHYNKMSQTELFNKYLETLEKMYSFRSSCEKAPLLFGNGSFNRPFNDGKPGWGFRMRMVFYLTKEYVFTSDKHKRKLFRIVISLIKSKKTVIDTGLAYLISMISYNRHIRKMLGEAETYRNLIRPWDKGSWESMKADNKQID